jgi:hypothetical protein
VRHRIHGLVGCLIDPGSTVAVVSKGDQGLVQFDSVEGWHFPQTADGRYAGHHPADAADAIAHLEQLRTAGADYFLLPSTYFWWLSHYDDLVGHLQSRYRLIAHCPDTCLLYHLRAGPVAAEMSVATLSAGNGTGDHEGAQNSLVAPIRALLHSLLPDHEPVLVVSDGDDELLRLGRVALHFPHDSEGNHRPTVRSGRGGISAQLSSARACGVKYLVVPETVARSGEAFELLRASLEKQGRRVAHREGICAIYELDRGPSDD